MKSLNSVHNTQNPASPFEEKGMPTRLVAGVAHDFKNLLSAVLGNLNLAEHSIEDLEKLPSLLASATKAAEKAQALAESLLMYATHGVVIDAPSADVAALIKDTAQFTLAGTGAALELTIPASLGQITLGSVAFTQVLQNLLVNALQAMNGQGLITLEAASTHNPNNLSPDPYLQLTITDTGPGIEASQLPHLFESGFTTKKTGHGLGLAQVKALIEDQGGHIEASSQPGKGATFTLYLPLAPLKPNTQITQKALEIRKNRGRILVLDDDILLRELAGEMLNALGYEAETVGKGEDALSRYQEARETGAPFSSVILDLSVPGALDGKAVLDRLKAYDPKVNAILSTGHTHNPLVKAFQKNGFSGCVLKPYKLDDLSQALNPHTSTNNAISS